MLAARLYGPHDLRLEDIEPPRPPEGWALIKSLAVGICGTDKAFYTGTYPLLKRPLVLGHEVVGKVVEGPEGLIDKLVVSEINFSCMKCSFCRMGLYTHCPHRKTLGIDFDGGMAEYFIAPLTSLHIVEGMDPIMAVEVEPLAAVLNMLEQTPPSPQSKVAVIGSGNLAILILQILRNMNIETVAIVRGDSPKRRYIESLDIETICTDKVEDYVAERTPEGMGFDMVIEASGSTEALNLAIDITRPRGIIHLKSTPGAMFKVNMTKAVVKELRVIGTRCGTFREFEKAIQMLREGIIKPIITTVVEGLAKAPEAFKMSLDRRQVKVVVKP